MRQYEVEDVKVPFPFDRYDLFGYIFSGASFSLLFMWMWNGFSFYKFKDFLDFFSNYSSFIQVSVFLVLILINYIVGNIMGAIANFFIDKMLIKGITGYPVASLLKIEQGSKDKIKISFFMSSMFWILLWIYVFISVVFWTKYSIWIKITYIVLGILFIIVIILRFITKIFSKSEKLLINKGIELWYRGVKKILYALGDIMGISRDLAPNFVEKYKEYFKNEFDITSEDSATENFWLCNLYVNRNDPILSSFVNKFLYLYGFIKNLSVSLFIVPIAYLLFVKI